MTARAGGGRVVTVRAVNADVGIALSVPAIAISVLAGGAGVPGVGFGVAAVRPIDGEILVAGPVPAVPVRVHATAAVIPSVGVGVIAVCAQVAVDPAIIAIVIDASPAVAPTGGIVGRAVLNNPGITQLGPAVAIGVNAGGTGFPDSRSPS